MFTPYPWGTYVIFTFLPMGNIYHLTYLPVGNICHFYLPTGGMFVIFTSPPLGGYLSLLQEQYLPFILHAKLKLACNGELDPSLVNFIENALQDEEKKALLEVWLQFKQRWGLFISCRAITPMS